MSQTISLGDIADIKGGKRLPKGEVLQKTPNTHPYLRIVDMSERFIKKTDLLYVPDNVFPKISRYTTNTNDVLLSIVGTIGLAAIVDKELDNASLTENCVKLTCHTEKIDPNFLYYFLISSQGQAEIAAGRVGSTQPKLPLYNIAKIKIPDLSIEEQKKIADILRALDEKIELNRKMNNTLEQMGQALFRHYFINNPEREKWVMIKLSDISFYISRGLSPKYSDNGESLVVNQRCIRSGRLSLENARRQSKSIPEEKLLKKGDVLINSTGVGTLGRVAQVDETLPNVTFDSHVTIVRPSVDIHFFGQLLRNLEPKLELLGRGTTGQTELSRVAVGDIRVSLPPHEMMSEFGAELAPVREQMHANDKQIQALTTLHDTLLPRLISGILDIK